CGTGSYLTSIPALLTASLRMRRTIPAALTTTHAATCWRRSEEMVMNEWDDLESEITSARHLLDDADGTPLSKLDHLLDRAAAHLDNALRRLGEVRATEGQA